MGTWLPGMVRVKVRSWGVFELNFVKKRVLWQRLFPYFCCPFQDGRAAGKCT